MAKPDVGGQFNFGLMGAHAPQQVLERSLSAAIAKAEEGKLTAPELADWLDVLRSQDPSENLQPIYEEVVRSPEAGLGDLLTAYNARIELMGRKGEIEEQLRLVDDLMAVLRYNQHSEGFDWNMLKRLHTLKRIFEVQIDTRETVTRAPCFAEAG